MVLVFYHTDCELQMVRKDRLEELIVNAIVDELSKKPIMDDMVAEHLKQQDSRIIVNAKLAALKREKAKVDKSPENLVMALEQGIMSATTNKRLHELEKQQAELERDILLEESKVITKIPESVIREFYAEALKQEAELMVNLLVRQIVLYNDRIEIQLNTPLKNGPDTDDRGRSFCIRHAEVRYATYHTPKQGYTPFSYSVEAAYLNPSPKPQIFLSPQNRRFPFPSCLFFRFML